MRTLFISTYFPPDLRIRFYGVYQRMDLFLEALAGLGSVEVLLFAPHPLEQCRRLCAHLQKVFDERWGPGIDVTVHPRLVGGRQPYPAERRVIRERIERRADCVFAHRLGVMSMLRKLRGGRVPPTLFDVDDVEHRKMGRMTAFIPGRIQRLRSRADALRLFVAERSCIRAATSTLVCSGTDRAYLERNMGVRNVRTIPNAVMLPTPIECSSDVDDHRRGGARIHARARNHHPQRPAVLCARVHRPARTGICCRQVRSQRAPAGLIQLRSVIHHAVRSESDRGRDEPG